MQKLSEFHQKLEADILGKIDSLKAGTTVKAAAYSHMMSNQHVWLYQILANLVSMQTDGSVVNHQKCLNYIKEYVKWANPRCIIQSIPTNGKDNLIIGLNVDKLEDIKTGVMFCGHLDVVGGKSKQFAPVTEGRRIYGRGTADMKGAISCYLAMIPYINTLKLPVVLCLTSDEETDMQSIRDVCSFLSKHNIKPKLAILGEPTDNKLGICSMGIKSYQTMIHGVSAHSSVPQKGVNALFVAAEILQALKTIMAKMQTNGLYLNVGSVNGGGNIALIPDKAKIKWGFRYAKEENAQRAVESYNKALLHISVQYPKAHIETTKIDEFLGYSAINSMYVAALRKILQVETINLAYTSEAGYLAESGQNVYLLGCGNIEQAHSDNEYIDIDDLIAYTSLLKRLLQSLFKLP